MAETTVTTAPASYAQPSRKGKKAWRKNVDISEVQSGLENVRDEIIKTGGIISQQTADQLFSTDLLGDDEVEGKQKGKKLLKVDEILAQRSAVPGLEGRKRKVEELVPTASKRYKSGNYVSHKELQRLKDVADNASGGVAVDEQASHDPWAETKIAKDPRLNFLDEIQQKKEPVTLKEAPLSLAASGRRIPDVRAPEAGKSYNPLVGDWSAMLEREGAAAVEAELMRLKAEAKAAAEEARVVAETEKVEKQERDEYGTDYESAWESEWEGFQSGAEEEAHVQKQSKRKTPAERNKIKARKEREAREKWERKQKERDAQEKQIAQIAKRMSARDKASRPVVSQQTIVDSSDSEDAGGVQLQRRRFGKLPIPDAPLEVVLPDELEDSLRRLKPEGNLLTDRYRNLLINGKVEVRKKQWQYRQAKTDRTEKWSYKDWRLK